MADVNCIERAVAFRAEISARVGCGSRGGYEGCLGGGVVQVLWSAPFLHVGMSFIQEEVAKQDADEKQSRADKVGEQVRKFCKNASRREDGRHGD